MTREQAEADFKKMVADIEIDIKNRQYYGMKDGIDAAVGFAKSRLADYSINPETYVFLLKYLQATVGHALIVE